MKKDDVIVIRINKENKKKIKMRMIQKDFKSLSEYILYCVMLDINKDINKE